VFGNNNLDLKSPLLTEKNSGVQKRSNTVIRARDNAQSHLKVNTLFNRNDSANKYLGRTVS
jgi:hypothetical protein